MSAGTFEIIINGTLSPAFVAAFDGFTATTTPQGLTHLVGWVPDQAKLHGALGLLRDLGIDLVSVTRVRPPPVGPDMTGRTEEES
jgi:hypothetical protein